VICLKIGQLNKKKTKAVLVVATVLMGLFKAKVLIISQDRVSLTVSNLSSDISKTNIL